MGLGFKSDTAFVVVPWHTADNNESDCEKMSESFIQEETETSKTIKLQRNVCFEGHCCFSSGSHFKKTCTRIKTLRLAVLVSTVCLLGEGKTSIEHICKSSTQGIATKKQAIKLRTVTETCEAVKYWDTTREAAAIHL